MERTQHSNSEALSPDVLRRVDVLWPDAEERRRVCDALATYGVESHEQEANRVRLAILKLSDGRVGNALTMVAAAKRDYRDVLMGAEYPEEGRAQWAIGLHLTPKERQLLRQIQRRDRKQYEDWLRESGKQRR
jgi:hypothetical protein